MERVFLDITARPLRERAVEAGWAPDDASEYCARCGRTLHAKAALPEGCDTCRGMRLAWSRIVRLGEYAGPLRTWIHEVKYTRWRRLGHDLGEMLGQALLARWIEHGGLSLEPVIVPVPDASLRRLLRGIDHAMVIARGVQAATGWRLAQPLHRRFGSSQVSVAPSERATNVARSFGIRKGFDIDQFRGGTVVLIDDVLTTGATLRTCARLIASACRKGGKGGGPNVWAAILARTGDARPTR